MPRWAWKLVRVAGIDVYVHGTFLLLIAFVALSQLASGAGVESMVRATLLVLAVFTTVVMHEYGHALMARRFGIRTRDITLWPIGGIARLEKMPDSPREQLFVALAGPAVNLAIAGLLAGVIVVFGGRTGIVSFSGTGDSFLAQLMWINVSLAVFNLLPGYPMDGGRVLRALLAMRMAGELATQKAARVGQGVALVFGLLGLLWSPILLVIAGFVWLAARAEHSGSRVRMTLAGLPVSKGMITEFETLSTSDPLSRATALATTGFQRDFPVVDGDRLVGVLSHADMLAGLAAPGANRLVEQAMRAEPEVSSPSTPLVQAMTSMQQSGRQVVVVVDGRKVVGLLTMGGIAQLLAVQAARRKADVVNAVRDAAGGERPTDVVLQRS